MSYRSVAEFMSERFHTDVEFLLELNGSKNTWSVKPGTGSLIVPNVKPFTIENISGKRYEADPKMSERHAVVDTKRNQVRIFEGAPPAMIVDEEEEGTVSTKPVLVKSKHEPNTALVASFPITPGKPQFIHLGVWKLNNSVELPVWRFDKSLLETGKRSNDALNIPPGPNSPVGIIWNGLSKPGIGLHGTSDPETIGRAQSAGCIRLANWDAIRIPTLLRPGATVEIRKH
jgi:lipoprotein-anchoring transpeptidase ErfK/SrfK